MYTYYQNTHTYTHPQVHTPTRTHTHTYTHPHVHTPTNTHTPTHTHTHITKQVKTTTVQVETNIAQDIPK